MIIKKPDDSNEYYEMDLEVKYKRGRSVLLFESAQLFATSSDPIHDSLKHYFSRLLKSRSKEWEFILLVRKVPIHIQYNRKYYVNGRPAPLNRISHALARTAFASINKHDAGQILTVLYNALELPENISYVLENRAPYHWYEDYVRVAVRLNVKQIGPTRFAIEISDGVWGEISLKNLDTFVNFYRHGVKRGSWKFLSPNFLFERLLGREPSRSEEALMKAFLLQNRQQDMVERRAKQLIANMVEKYPEQLHYVSQQKEDWTEEVLYVKGQIFDWKLRKNSDKASRQSVHSYIWQPRHTDSEDNESPSDSSHQWLGPICIDNMTSGTVSIGDQFIARAMPLMNDLHIEKMVYTIKQYISDRNPERLTFEQMRETDGLL